MSVFIWRFRQPNKNNFKIKTQRERETKGKKIWSLRIKCVHNDIQHPYHCIHYQYRQSMLKSFATCISRSTHTHNHRQNLCSGKFPWNLFCTARQQNRDDGDVFWCDRNVSQDFIYVAVQSHKIWFTIVERGKLKLRIEEVFICTSVLALDR